MRDIEKITQFKKWPGCVAAVVLFVWYASTMNTGLEFFDSGELALVAKDGGVSHPPGQPIYTLVSYLVARMPGLDPLVALNGLSAACLALCALPLDALLIRLTHGTGTLRLLAILAAFALAPMWDQGTRIEIYASATLCSLCLLAWGAKAIGLGGTKPLRSRSWLGLGLLSGITVSVNAVFGLSSAAAVGLCAVPGFFRDETGFHASRGMRKLFKSTGFAAVGAIAVVGLAYFYMISATKNSEGAFVWGDFNSLKGFLRFLTGGDYGHTRSETAALQASEGVLPYVFSHLKTWFLWIVKQGGAPVLCTAFLGFFTRRLRSALILCGLPIVALLWFTLQNPAFFPEIPDYNGYLAPMYALSALGLCASLQIIAKTTRYWVAVLVGCLLIASALMGERPITERTRHDMQAAKTLAENYIQNLPKDSILIAGSDHVVFSIFYLQKYADLRPDVLFINWGFAGNSWYWRYLHQTYKFMPEIDLKAPNSAVRLERLFSALPNRRIFTENLSIARQFERTACPATFTVELITPPAECDASLEDGNAFSTVLNELWRSKAGRDSIGSHILAQEGRARAEACFFTGNLKCTMESLAAGTPYNLPIPSDLPTSGARGFLPKLPEKVLFASAEQNAVVGALILHQIGLNPDSWLSAAENSPSSFSKPAQTF